MSARGLRVTGGELCGRRLRIPGGDIRPTGDRVRESLFARLAPFDGIRVLDLYAGTGILGVEALSRGAESAVFVEQASSAVAALEHNLTDLGLRDSTRVVRGDVSRAVKRLGRDGDRFELVLVDPPYASEETPKALAALGEAGILIPDAVVVVEYGRRHPVSVPPEWVALDEWDYGETQVVRLGRATTTGDDT